MIPQESSDFVVNKPKLHGVHSHSVCSAASDHTGLLIESSIHTFAKVFVIEDDPMISKLLQAKFEASKIDSRFSCDGIDVIDKIRIFKPQVIIFDIIKFSSACLQRRLRLA
jgi:hypothetical protein